jgi:hypothetical protein
MGLEPTPGPWQGPVLPLYYDRPEHENFSTSTLQRQVYHRSVRRSEGSLIQKVANGFPFISDNLQNACHLYDWRLPLTFREFRGFGAVRVYPAKSLTIFVKNSYLPVLVLTAFILAKLRAFPLYISGFDHSLRLSQLRRARTSTDSCNAA